MYDESEIKEMYETIYEDEPNVGDWVIIKHNYNETIITGEVQALKHTQPQRGWHAEADFEFVVWSAFAIKIAGVKGWLKADKWEILNTMPDFEDKKLTRKKREEN
jgi:hypothetical protein